MDLPVAPLDALRLRRSAKWQTYPSDVLPLTVAEMDFDLAEPIVEALSDAIGRSDTGYSMPGQALGAAIADFAADRWSWDLDPARVTAVPDVGVGVVELLRLIGRPGDPVVISPPVYPPFFDWVREADRRIQEVPLRDDGDGWVLDLAALERAFAGHPAAYVLCNPHNPVGRVHTADELASLVDLARSYDVTIVSDEIHAPLVLGRAHFTPLLSVPGGTEVAIALISASKAWNLAGLKCAAIITGAEHTQLTDRLPPDLRWRPGHLGVLATVAAFTDGRDWLDDLTATLTHRRDYLGELLARDLPALRWHPPAATFLAWLDCSSVDPGPDLQRRLVEQGRVALEPGTRFGAVGAGFLRLNFATSTDILDGAVERIAKVLSQG